MKFKVYKHTGFSGNSFHTNFKIRKLKNNITINNEFMLFKFITNNKIEKYEI